MVVLAEVGGGPTASPSPTIDAANRAKAKAAGVPDSVWDTAPASTKQKKVPKVWLPGTKRYKVHTQKSSNGMDYAHGWNGPQYTDMTGAGEQPADQVINWMYDEKKRKQIIAALQKEGYEFYSFQDAFDIWKAAVSHASDAYDISGIEMSPFTMLHIMAPTEAEKNKKKPYPWRGQAWDQTQTTTHIADMGPEMARGILTNALSQALGRDPTQEEIEDFASRANAIVSANPQVSQDTTHYEWDPKAGPNGGDYVPVSSTSKEIGPSAQEVQAMVQNEALDQARATPEYGAYQASTTYFNYLMQALASPISGG